MSPAPRSLDKTAVTLMLGLCALWSLQQISLKAASPLVAPLALLALRSALAATLVGLLMWRRGERPARERWLPGLAAGTLFALEYLLVAEALRHTHASHTTVFLYTSPIFAALGLHWRVAAERLNRWQWAGIALAFAGVAWAFLGRGQPDAAHPAGRMLWGDFLALLAGLSWGATTVVLRGSTLTQAPATEALLYQLLAAFAVLGCAALLTGQTRVEAGSLFWTHLLFQGVIVSFASFLLWFWLLRRYLASRLGVLSFMTPLFGVVFGAALLGETLDPAFLLGGALVLAGVLVVNLSGVRKAESTTA